MENTSAIFGSNRLKAKASTSRMNLPSLKATNNSKHLLNAYAQNVVNPDVRQDRLIKCRIFQLWELLSGKHIRDKLVLTPNVASKKL